ncbi:MAG: NADP-dependent oxidoreductase [Burkholderiaceae bacterium]
MSLNRRIVLASRPVGDPVPENFEVQDVPMPEPGEGQVLVKTLWLSIAPYMRWRMNDAKSYAPPVALGDVMVGATVGEVVRSRHSDFAAGDIVIGLGGWQQYAVCDGKALRKQDAEWGKSAVMLGVLGGNGMTAYAGLFHIGKPKPGETVVVAAASGGVGSLVGQMAKLRGARAVGIAGGPEKCRFVVDELGFDTCLDHRAPDFPQALAKACPDGIDVYFENVGGAVWNAVLPLLNDFARVPVCGVISQYSATEPPPGPDRTPELMRLILSRRLELRGFVLTDFLHIQEEFNAAAVAWHRAGQLRYREDVHQGIDAAPQAFIGMLKGRNFGKVLVQVAQD